MIAVYELLYAPSARYPDGLWFCVLLTTDHERVWYEQHLSVRLGMSVATVQVAPFSNRQQMMITILPGQARADIGMPLIRF
jgi:hypothetical protein